MIRLFVLAASAGFLLAILGPFGTYRAMPLAERLLFWELVLLCAAALHVPALWLADRLGQLAGMPPIIWVPGAGLAAAAPTALIVTGISATLYGLSRAPAFANMYLFVVSISVPMQVLSYFVLSGSNRSLRHTPEPVASLPEPSAFLPHAEVAAPSPVSEPEDIPLLDRLPPQLGRKVQCLEMQDHYVRVHTLEGSTLLLMRLRDAEAEMGTMAGERVHRSWWVAREAVICVQRRGQSVALELANGLTVPVSRARLGALRALGWLDDGKRNKC